MNTYERLQTEACRDGIDVVDYRFESDRIKGLYCDGIVAVRNDMITTEKTCTLAEELGHHYTTYGDILDQSDPRNRKQEILARTWAYDRQIGLIRLISAYEHGCQNRFEIAEYLDVTEEFLGDALKRYQDKYGVYTVVDNYVVYFVPNLAVCRIM